MIDTTSGDIYVSTGNGLWDGSTNWGDAVIRLDSSATMILGNYTPANTLSLNRTDTDLGSTSPVLLDSGYIAQGGKDSLIRVLSPSAMAGATPHKGGEDQVVSTQSRVGAFTAPAVYRASTTTTLFTADGDGTAAWSVSGGRLSLLWSNANCGTSPVVAGGLLFIYDQRDGGLRVYQPATGTVVATLPAGSGHWNSPIVVDGRIALPEGDANSHSTSGILDIWRLPR